MSKALLFSVILQRKSYGRSVERFPSLLAVTIWIKCIFANVFGHISASDASILILKKAKETTLNIQSNAASCVLLALVV